jgi:hypothetical protein
MGLTGAAAYVAAVIPLAAILWDSVDGPEVALATSDGGRLAQTGGATSIAVLIRVFNSVIQVMGGARDAYPSCLDAFADLDALDARFIAELSGICVSAVAELVGDHHGATTHALRWVRFCRRSGVRMMLTCGIRGAARLSAVAGHPDRSLRLWGGAEHIETVTVMRYMPLMQRLDRPLLQQCTDALGNDASRLLAEGASWSVAEATQAAEEALLGLQGDEPGTEPGMPVAPPGV